MSGFREPDPEIITPNPGGADDPLGESILDSNLPGCRVFEPKSPRVVIGRHQNVHREVHLAACQADGVPIHRRLSGGGAVVLAPGMLVLALRMRLHKPGSDQYLCAIARQVAQVIAAQGGPTCQVCGHGDVAVPQAHGPARKVLGASLRQRRDQVYYLGVLLVADAVPLMRRYLAPPSRQPDYRQGRDHDAFCDCLGRYGLAISPLAAALPDAILALDPGHADGLSCANPP